MAERSDRCTRHQQGVAVVQNATGACLGFPSIWNQTGWSFQSYPEALGAYDHRIRSWDIDEQHVDHLEAGVPLPTNYYRDQRVQATYPIGKWEEYGKCSTADVWTLRVSGSGPMCNGAITPDTLSVDSDLMAQAKLDVLEQVKNMSINLAVFSAEAPKTVDLLRSSFEKMFAFGLALKSGRWRQAYRHLYPYSRARDMFRPASRDFARQVLEYKYAWTPLMFDCYGAAKALAEELGGRPPVKSFTNRKRRNDSWVTSIAVMQPRFVKPTGSDGIGTTTVRTMPRTFDVSTSIERVQQATAGLRVSPICNDVRNYGLNDPLLVAWELVPFSFVFDWFVSVGDYLSAATALRGLKVESGWASDLIVLQGTQNWIPRTTQGWMLGPVVEMRRNYTRNPWSGSLPSMLSLVNQDPFGLSQLISTMALARIRFR